MSYVPKTHTSVAVSGAIDLLIFLLIAIVLLDLKGGDLFLFAAGWVVWDLVVAIWRDTR